MTETIVETFECPITGDVTVYLSNDTAQKFARSAYQDKGFFEAWLESMEIFPSTGRTDVMQYGVKVGELPSFWHPALAQSSSPLYDYRRGDLTLTDGKWHAVKGLGAKDLDCLIGFVRKPESPKG